ncbi:hypothetical protein PO909_023392 [Leuciscus waleckii]
MACTIVPETFPFTCENKSDCTEQKINSDFVIYVCTQFVPIAQESTEFFSFVVNFIRRAVTSPLNDETLKLLFWIRANFHQATDLPNTDGLNWREAISRHLVSVAFQSREQPPSPAAAEITLPKSRPAKTTLLELLHVMPIKPECHHVMPVEPLANMPAASPPEPSTKMAAASPPEPSARMAAATSELVHIPRPVPTPRTGPEPVPVPVPEPVSVPVPEPVSVPEPVPEPEHPGILFYLLHLFPSVQSVIVRSPLY